MAGKPLTVLAGAIAMLAGPLGTHAGTPAPETLYHGALVRLEGELPDKRDQLRAVDAFRMGPSVGQGFRRAIARPDLAWYGFSLFHGDSALMWDAGDSLALTFGARTVTAQIQFAMSPPPEQRVMPLAGPLRPGELWRARAHGGIATVVFAGFPRLRVVGANPEVRPGVIVKLRSQAALESARR
jgi:hypothetical protein